MKKWMILLLLVPFLSMYSYSFKLNVKYTPETKDIYNEIYQCIEDNDGGRYIEFVTDDSSDASNVISFNISFNATDNTYEATWKYQDELKFYSYNPSDSFENKKNFILECASFILEKISIYRYATNDYGDYLQLTFHPGVDEYGDFSPSGRCILFITDRLSGNRNPAYFDVEEDRLYNLPIYGSSEYFPKFSPDGTKFAFVGSLHGFWNIYYTNFRELLN